MKKIQLIDFYRNSSLITDFVDRLEIEILFVKKSNIYFFVDSLSGINLSYINIPDKYYIQKISKNDIKNIEYFFFSEKSVLLIEKFDLQAFINSNYLFYGIFDENQNLKLAFITRIYIDVCKAIGFNLPCFLQGFFKNFFRFEFYNKNIVINLT